MLTQADQRIAQLTQRGARSIPGRTRYLDLFPQFKQSARARNGQVTEQLFDFGEH